MDSRGNGLAVAGFVCGLVATVFGVPLFIITLDATLPFILGLLGIVFGAIGWHRARRDPARGGKGLAVAGIILGLMGPLLEIVLILLIVAAFSDVD